MGGEVVVNFLVAMATLPFIIFFAQGSLNTEKISPPPPLPSFSHCHLPLSLFDSHFLRTDSSIRQIAPNKCNSKRKLLLFLVYF